MKNKLIISLVVFSLILGNFCYAQAIKPDDSFYYLQWYLQELNMEQVWGQETGDNKIVIAIIDSGVDTAHPDIHDNIWINQDEIFGDGIDNDNNGYVDDINGWDFIADDNDPRPKYPEGCLASDACYQEAILHGTFVAGVAAAVGNNSQGIAGMAWQTKIMPLRVLNETGYGNTSAVIDAINYAIGNGADIINLSFVGETFDKALELTLQRAYDNGLVIVAAAGNEDFAGHTFNLDLTPMYPVCHKSKNDDDIIIGVGAVDRTKKLGSFSNYGSSCVDVMAPGEDFFGLLVYDKKEELLQKYYGGGFSGTSIAAPIVSGLVALMKSFAPSLSNHDIYDLIINNTEDISQYNPGYADKIGHGLINPVRIFQTLNPKEDSQRLIKGSSPAVYYQALDGKRYVFPNQATYFSWFSDFSQVTVISDSALAAIPIGGNVTIRPGTKLIKVQSIPKVYAVDRGGQLRWIATEELAISIYGPAWAGQVVDMSDAFWVNYQTGLDITDFGQYDLQLIQSQIVSIDIDKGLIL